MTDSNLLGAQASLKTNAGDVSIYRLDSLEKQGGASLNQMPYSLKVVLESLLRNASDADSVVTQADVEALMRWTPSKPPTEDIPFMVARVLLQDFTGVPCVVDLAAMRDTMKAHGGDPKRINPLIPTELVVDHSVQIDQHGTKDALEYNEKREFERNQERYQFLKWGQSAFDNFKVIPPSTGIVHQVNLEYLGRVVCLSDNNGKGNGKRVAYPDSVLGADSHTTMINGMGILGWGVGGIEAEASMLGQPYYMLAPQVVGVRLEGAPQEGVLATDVVLYLTEMLRELGVVSKFVEFFGPGLAELTLPDRATLANMAPEYGATVGFFPVDQQTISYLHTTGRSVDHIDLVERYLKEQGMFITPDSPDPAFSQTVTFNLSDVRSTLAGPKRPQDRVALPDMATALQSSLDAPIGKRGYALDAAQQQKSANISLAGKQWALTHGSVVLAAITSCTNTSNPHALVAAGLIARNAAAKGLTPPAYVKASLAPGSRVVSDYLEAAGLLPDLEKIGFHIVGYGCTSCIGNSGPIIEEVAEAIKTHDLIAAGVLSGNRNFEGRINPSVAANYLGSPALVVAFALAGTVNIDLTTTPLGNDIQGQPVYLKDIWPRSEDIDQLVKQAVTQDKFKARYAEVLHANPRWNAIVSETSDLYAWDDQSTYVQNPPYFADFSLEDNSIQNIIEMRVLGMFGDSVTTDHISPAGSIQPDTPAGKYLLGKDVSQQQFNSFGARRGNDQIMTRGTFGNLRIKNLLVSPTEGGWTIHWPSGEQVSIFDAAMQYKSARIPLMIIGGKEYGTGSSRDWAAKGTLLLGVKAVLVESFERIHRSNLVGMGVLPLQFQPGDNASSLGLTGQEVFAIEGLSDTMLPQCEVQVVATDPTTSNSKRFTAKTRIDTSVEIDYYRNGGIMQTVLRKLLKGESGTT